MYIYSISCLKFWVKHFDLREFLWPFKRRNLVPVNQMLFNFIKTFTSKK